MNTKEAYNVWASQYDTNENKTRDLEAFALRKSLENISFDKCLEIGCGTGKNTEWLAMKTQHLTAIDFSEQMISRAKEKIVSGHVQFKQADITRDWNFTEDLFDLVSFSLVLEHIENLDHIFQEVSRSLKTGGYVYVGELHPFKQYTGTKARFDTADGTKVLECYTHHISDFVQSAKKHGLMLADIKEYFDENETNAAPRVLVIILRKQ